MNIEFRTGNNFFKNILSLFFVVSFMASVLLAPKGTNAQLGCSCSSANNATCSAIGLCCGVTQICDPIAGCTACSTWCFTCGGGNRGECNPQPIWNCDEGYHPDPAQILGTGPCAVCAHNEVTTCCTGNACISGCTWVNDDVGCKPGSYWHGRLACVADCTATAPTSLKAERYATSVKLTWTRGTQGISQLVRIGTNLNKVNSGCPDGVGPGTGCVVKTTIPVTDTFYTSGDVLSPTASYHYRVVTFKDATCYASQLVSCTATPPTNLGVVRSPSGTQISQITWDPGTGGTKQHVYADLVESRVSANCPANNCAIQNRNLPPSRTFYNTGGALTSERVYYDKVVTYENASCLASSSVQTILSSCDLSPNPLSLTQGMTRTMTVAVAQSSESKIERVDFSSSHPSALSANEPPTDTTWRYQTLARALQPVDPATLTGRVYFAG